VLLQYAIVSYKRKTSAQAKRTSAMQSNSSAAAQQVTVNVTFDKLLQRVIVSYKRKTSAAS
jgi:hypothetical protein